MCHTTKADKAEAEAKADKAEECVSCGCFANQCPHWCTSCYQEMPRECNFCREAEAEAEANSEVEVKADVTVKPTLVEISIPSFQTFYALKWPDGSICTVSAVMPKMPTNINDVSMEHPFCMLIALFVANISFFVKRGYRSPYQLVKFVENNLNLQKGQMLDLSTIHLLENLFNVNVDIRFQQNGPNWNGDINKKLKTLNPIILRNNHYMIEGLDT
jgi:hypothetical protein